MKLAHQKWVGWHETLKQGPILLLLLLAFPAATWQAGDGLTQNSVTSIVQTPEGYLWLATFRGLARLDGERFEVFDDGNTPA